MFDNYKDFTDHESECPKCLLYDGTECEFSNGDTITIEREWSYHNGYVVSLTWYDHESELTWDGIEVFCVSGHMYMVDYLALAIDEDGFEFVDTLYVNESECIGTQLYMDAKTEWKAYWFACMSWV